MHRLAVIAAVALSAAAPLDAAVRLEQTANATRVRVIVDLAGPWAPVGQADAKLLNPLGVLRGDGAPSIAVSRDVVLAAWTAAAGRDIALALGEQEWTPLASLASATPSAPPLVVSAPFGWVVAWSSAPGGDLFLCTVTRDGRVASPVRIADGTPEALARTGECLQVVSRTAGGTLVVLTLPPIDQEPPIYRVIRVTTLATSIAEPTTSRPRGLGASRTLKLPQDSPLVFRSGNTTTLLDPAWQGTAATGTSSVALAGSLVGTVQLSEERALALWWHDAHTLEFVELAADGVGSVQRVIGRGEFSPSLVREALRIATQE